MQTRAKKQGSQKKRHGKYESAQDVIMAVSNSSLFGFGKTHIKIRSQIGKSNFFMSMLIYCHKDRPEAAER